GTRLPGAPVARPRRRVEPPLRAGRRLRRGRRASQDHLGAKDVDEVDRERRGTAVAGGAREDAEADDRPGKTHSSPPAGLLEGANAQQKLLPVGVRIKGEVAEAARDPGTLAERAKALALETGFDVVGIAAADAPPELSFFAEWLGRGYAGEMAYLTTQAG